MDGTHARDISLDALAGAAGIIPIVGPVLGAVLTGELQRKALDEIRDRLAELGAAVSANEGTLRALLETEEGRAVLLRIAEEYKYTAGEEKRSMLRDALIKGCTQASQRDSAERFTAITIRLAPVHAAILKRLASRVPLSRYPQGFENQREPGYEFEVYVLLGEGLVEQVNNIAQQPKGALTQNPITQSTGYRITALGESYLDFLDPPMPS